MKYLVFVCALLAGPALAEPPVWVGNWAAEPEWCQWVDKIGSRNPAPIEITEKELNGLENFCDITKVETVTGGSWKLTLSCWSEGNTYDDERLLMYQYKDILWLWYGNGEPTRFTRCEG